MSNQRKAEFINGNVHIQSFWGGHDKISSKPWLMPKGIVSSDFVLSRPVEFPTVVTHKSLIVSSRITDHRDEDINTLATIIPSIDILGPITCSRAQQLNHQVNSFLCSSAYNIESRLLPKDLIVLRNQGKDHGGQIQFRITEFESNSEFRTTLYSNWCTECIRPPFWTFYICTES
jgi:hypothetical protein